MRTLAIATLTLLIVPHVRALDRRLPWGSEAFELPPAPNLVPLPPNEFVHGRRDENLIALTFDACTTHGATQYDARITRTLLETGTPATIFMGGRWALKEADHVRFLASFPQFELGNHTWSHPHLRQVDEARIREELQLTQAALFQLTGRIPKLFRAPFVETDARVIRIAGELGLTTIQNDLASGDPDSSVPARELRAWVRRQATPGAIVVFHMNHLSFRTAEALPGIIQDLKARGFTFVTIGTLLKRSVPAKIQPTSERPATTDLRRPESSGTTPVR